MKKRDILIDDSCPYNSSKTIGDELLTPTRIYIEILDVLKVCEVHGLAHITGSGLLKLRRVTKLGFDFYDPLEPQEIFKFLQEEGRVEDLEMYRTFNMGMGFLVILPERICSKSFRNYRWKDSRENRRKRDQNKRHGNIDSKSVKLNFENQLARK